MVDRIRKDSIVINWGGVVTNVLDCDIAVSKFEIQSRYYVQTNIFVNGMNLLIP